MINSCMLVSVHPRLLDTSCVFQGALSEQRAVVTARQLQSETVPAQSQLSYAQVDGIFNRVANGGKSLDFAHFVVFMFHAAESMFRLDGAAPRSPAAAAAASFGGGGGGGGAGGGAGAGLESPSSTPQSPSGAPAGLLPFQRLFRLIITAATNEGTKIQAVRTKRGITEAMLRQEEVRGLALYVV